MAEINHEMQRAIEIVQRLIGRSAPANGWIHCLCDQ